VLSGLGWLERMLRLACALYPRDFRTLLAADDELTGVLDAARLDLCFDPNRFLSHVDEIFRRVFDT
jgi:adenylosuccinate lyase